MKDQSVTVPLIALAVFGTLFAGLLLLGSSRAKASPALPPPEPQPIGLPDGVKVGDQLLVNVEKAGIRVALPMTTVAIVMVVDFPRDVEKLVVRGVNVLFEGEIPRSSIMRVLTAPAPGVFA